jgi:hypothetical protein
LLLRFTTAHCFILLMIGLLGCTLGDDDYASNSGYKGRDQKGCQQPISYGTDTFDNCAHNGRNKHNNVQDKGNDN